PSTSTMHWRQAPIGSSRGRSQKRGTVIPMRSAARITRVPLGTVISRPSIVRVTGWVCTSVMSCPCQRRRTVPPAVVGDVAGLVVDVVGQPAVLDVLLELVAEVLQRRLDGAGGAGAERAEGAAEDVLADLVEEGDVLVTALALQEARQD